MKMSVSLLAPLIVLAHSATMVSMNRDRCCERKKVVSIFICGRVTLEEGVSIGWLVWWSVGPSIMLSLFGVLGTTHAVYTVHRIRPCYDGFRLNTREKVFWTISSNFHCISKVQQNHPFLRWNFYKSSLATETWQHVENDNAWNSNIQNKDARNNNVQKEDSGNYNLQNKDAQKNIVENEKATIDEQISGKKYLKSWKYT